MAELNLKERLQPALLDRLIDEARYITVFRIRTESARLNELQIDANALLSILTGQGLQRTDQPIASRDATEAREPGVHDAALEWVFTLGAASVTPAHLKQLTLKPPGAPAGIALQEFCTIESWTTLNEQPETAAELALSMRRLRESVHRDLVWLLNSSSLDAIDDLRRYPEVARSVVNFGMPTFAGKALHAIEPLAAARRIKEVIETFEPRLSRVQVLPATDREGGDGMTLAFRIEADLWGYPASQHLVMRTSIDTETGNVRISDSN